MTVTKQQLERAMQADDYADVVDMRAALSFHVYVQCSGWKWLGALGLWCDSSNKCLTHEEMWERFMEYSSLK